MNENIKYLLITLAAAGGMEFVAWFSHKYIMHGILWSWHSDHHKPSFAKNGFWERNDLFFIVFAVPSAACYMIGSMTTLYELFFVGIGISIYGLIYFLIHDVYIHRRFQWINQVNNSYSKAVLRAHGAHHSKLTKENCESFGLLVINPKYFKSQR